MKMTARERWILAAKAFGVGTLVVSAMAALFLPIQRALATWPL